MPASLRPQLGFTLVGENAFRGSLHSVYFGTRTMVLQRPDDGRRLLKVVGAMDEVGAAILKDSEGLLIR